MADNTILTMNDDWGGFKDSSNVDRAATGREVQDFIKSQLNSKPGFFASVDSTTTSTLLGFVDKAGYDAWIGAGSNLDDTNYIVAKTTFNKSQPQPYQTAYIESISPSNIISLDGKVVLNFIFQSMNNVWNDSTSKVEATPTGLQGILTVEKRSNNNWNEIYTSRIDSAKEISLDISNYCSDGDQQIRLSVTTIPANEGDSAITTSYAFYNVTKTVVDLIYAKDWAQAQKSSVMELSFGILGIVNKKLHVEISGAGGTTPRKIIKNLGTTVYNTTLGQTAYSFNLTDTLTDTYKVLKHGVHNIKAWIEVVETGEMVAERNIQIMMATDPSDEKAYLLLNNVNVSPINWTEEHLFDYCIYSPTNTIQNFTAILGDYNSNVEYLKYGPIEMESNKKDSYTNSLEIESQQSTVYAPLKFYINDVLVNTIQIAISNSGAYGPTPGACFILDPKSRSNYEAEKNIIFNKAESDPEKSKITANWNGFNFNNDAWIDSTTGKCLRVLAGQELTIDYNPFYNDGDDVWVDNCCTIEMSIATRNIIDGNIPVLKICNYNENGTFNGIEFLPNAAALMTSEQNIYKNQDIVFQEGVKTHIAFNIFQLNDLRLVRIFVNGRINREFSLNAGEIIYDVNNTLNKRKIVIGSTTPGADVDIYNIRVYKKKLSSSEIFNDYISTLATAAEKDAELFANDITVNGEINYDLASAKYNTLLWRPREKSGETTCVVSKANGDTKDSYYYGELVINVLTTDATGALVQDEFRSGIIKDLSVKGQGTSSMGYWKWNQRWEFDKIPTGEVDKDGEDICIETKFYDKAGSEGVGSWLVEEGCPRAKRIDGKINWASPMQSHKMGSTALYHDLWKKVVGNNAITSRNDGQSFTGTTKGYADCRVAIKQLPFMLFEQKEEGGTIEFIGLYTVGASKGDKPTFGYNKKDARIKPFIMMEGCDNGAQLVNHRIPWNDVDISMDADKEVYLYNSSKQWEISMGKYGDAPAQLAFFKRMCNFLYTINPDIHPFLVDGEPGTNFNDPDQTKGLSQQSFYWVVQSNVDNNLVQYDLYRYHDVLKKWVKAGIERVIDADGKVLEEYEPLNLKTQCEGIYDPILVEYGVMNQNFIDARVKLFSDGIEEFIHKDDLLYTMQFLKLIAASDNWAKNTYLYSTGWADEECTIVEKFRFFQDDLDTIFASNNTGQKTKPYYIEEHDVDEAGSNYWNASTNALYCLAEKAWPIDLRITMNKILTNMSDLGGSIEGCFDKYYNFVQSYFPAIAYNEIARLLYEDAKINKDAGKYDGLEPLSQCLGDQLQAEKYWQNLRIPYISSYAMYGEFEARDNGTTEGAMTFRSALVDGKQHQYNLTLTPYIWMYPSIGVGQSPTHDAQDCILQRKRAGETFNYEFETDGNTNIRIRGINYYSSIGDFGNVANALDADGLSVTVAGNRLTDFVVTSENTEKGILFRPASLSFASSMTNLSNITIAGSSYGADIVTGGLDLSKLWRLKTVDLTGTKATAVYFPSNSNITSIKLPSTLTKLELLDLNQLSTFEIGSCSRIKQLEIRNCGVLSSYDIFLKCYNEKATLESVKLYNINWTNVKKEHLLYLIDVYTCDVTGSIYMDPTVDIDFSLKMKLLDKFGNIDDVNNPLYINYTKKVLSGEKYISILGSSNIYTVGSHQFTLNYPAGGGETANDFTSVVWSVSNTQYCSINNSGVLTYNGGAKLEDKLTATIKCVVKHPGNTSGFTITKVINLYPRLARVGDYVYADGSYGDPSEYTGLKDIIATCFYVDGSQDVNTQKRLAVSIETLKPAYCYYGEVGTNTPINDIGETGVTSSSTTYNIREEDVLAYLSDPTNEKYKTTAMANIGWASGLPMGKSNTNTLLQVRNDRVEAAQITVPTKDNFANLLEANGVPTADGKVNRRLIYYPAASYCSFYQPSVNVIDKFKEGNWFLPSIGELIQIWYQIRFGGKPAFTKHKIGSQQVVWSSTEYDKNFAWVIKFYANSNNYDIITGSMRSSGQIGYKASSTYAPDAGTNAYVLLPVVEF